MQYKGLVIILSFISTIFRAEVINFRIKLDYQAFTPDFTNVKATNQLQIAQKFIQDLIMINRPTNDVIKPVDTQCGGIAYPFNSMNGFKATDLYIFVIHDSTIVDTTIQGQRCELSPPRFGYIKLNIDKFKDLLAPDLQTFLQELIRTFMNIIVFDKQLFDNFLPRPDINNLVISSKVAGMFVGKQLNLQKTKTVVMNYFGCTDSSIIKGVPLENTQILDTITRWETTLLMEDIMSSTKLQYDGSGLRLKFSVIDVTLLQESGFYLLINGNMAESMTYGKNKGCSFYENGCASSFSFTEFCNIPGKMKCNIQSTQLSSCQSNDQTNNCSYYQGKEQCDLSKQLCLDQSDVTLDSICLQSRILSSTSSIEIEITDDINNKYTCKNNGDILSTHTYQIRCPADIKAYSDAQSIECPNYCSSNGYCNNGICYCLDGFFGNDCNTSYSTSASKKSNQYSYNLKMQNVDDSMTSCPSGYEQSSVVTKDAINYITCKCSFTNHCSKCARYECAQCIEGYTLNDTKVCINCNDPTDYHCAKCTLNGVNPPTCTQCKTGYILKNDGTCLANCTSAQYFDDAQQKCVDCLIGCATCQQLTQCTTCTSTFNYDIPLDTPLGKRICYKDCGDKMAAIKDNSQANFNVCELCTKGDGYQNCEKCHFEGTTKKCDTCINNFKVSDADGKCSICADTYFLKDQACLRCAQDHCIQCQTLDACIKCENGYYVKQGKCVTDCGVKFYADSLGQCQPCIDSCDICKTGADCIVCGNKYYYDSSQNKKGCTLSANGCDSTCNLCTKPGGPSKDFPIDQLKFQSCYTCKSQPLIPNFTPSTQSSSLSNGDYYGQCQDFCFENQMQRNQPKYETTNSICLFCDADNLCKKCNKDGGCSECSDKSKYYLDPDSQKCVLWELSCVTKDDVLGCISCYNSQYVGYKQTCIKQCPEDYKTISDGNNYYCKKIQCYYSCATCAGEEYNECLTCQPTRKLDVYHGAFFGMCTCQNDTYTDTYQPQCQKKDSELNYEISSYFFTSSALVVSGVTSAILFNPISFFFLADHAQSVGQLTYVDKMNSYGLDRSMSGYKYFNLNILIPSPIVNQKLEQKRVLKGEICQVEQFGRVLTSGIDVKQFRGQQNTSKIVDYHNSKNYLYAGFWSFIVLAIIWTIKAIGHIFLAIHQKSATPGGVKVDTPKPPKWMHILEEYFLDLLPLGVFLLTCSELTLLSFLDFRDNSQYMQDSDSFEVVSVVFASLYLLFGSVYLLYLSFSPKEGIIYSLFDEYRKGSMFFYIFLALKKIIQSILLVFLEGSPTSQAFSVLIIETLFIFYLILVRPFKRETFFNLIYIGGEILVFVVIIVYTIMSFTTDKVDSQNNCAQALLILMMFLMIYHIISGFILIAYFIFKCCRKERPSQRYNAPSNDQKYHTDAGILKNDDLNSAKKPNDNMSVELETNNAKTPATNKHMINHPIQEESFRNDGNSADIPTLFKPNQLPQTDQYKLKKGKNLIQQEENDQVFEQEEKLNAPPANSQRQEQNKHHHFNAILLDGSENMSDISQKDDKISKVPVFEQIKDKQIRKISPQKGKQQKDYSPKYIKSSSASRMSESGVYSQQFNDEGTLENQEKDQHNQSRTSKAYLELQSQITPYQQSNIKFEQKKQNLQQINNHTQRNQILTEEDDDGSQGYFANKHV